MLAVLIAFTRRHWARIFQRTTASDFGTMIVFAILSLIASFTVGISVKAIFGTNTNTATDGIHRRRDRLGVGTLLIDSERGVRSIRGCQRSRGSATLGMTGVPRVSGFSSTAPGG